MVARPHCFHDVALEPPDCFESGKRRRAIHLYPVLNSRLFPEILDRHSGLLRGTGSAGWVELQAGSKVSPQKSQTVSSAMIV